MQGIDPDALQDEGLDLDLVDQMKDLAIRPDDDSDSATGTSSKADIAAAFEVSAPSTKVCWLFSADLLHSQCYSISCCRYASHSFAGWLCSGLHL